MRLVIALSLLFSLLPALPAQDKLSDEEIKRLTDVSLNQCDTDGNGSIDLAEMHARLEAFYIAFAKAGQSDQKQEAVRAQYPGMLTLQHFLAADLDDDNVVAEADLKWLFAHEEIEGVWTLSDADIALMVDDFILRMRKGAKSHRLDYLRKPTGKGRSKAEKLADRAEPYKHRVIDCVLSARMRAAIVAAYTDAELKSLYATKGREWSYQVTSKTEGQKDSKWNLGAKIVDKSAPSRRASSIDSVRYLYPEGHDPKIDVSLRSYVVGIVATSVSMTVTAGTFDCDLFEVECLSWKSRSWVLKEHPALRVKHERSAPSGKTTGELTAYLD